METNMTTGRPMGLIFRFTVPLFLGNAFQQIYNMADSMIVGKFVSANALAAVGSTGTIMFLVLGIAIGLTTGFSVMTSQYYGAGNSQGVHYSVTNGILMSIVFTLFLTAVSLFSMPGLLRLMNTPEDIFDDALRYISIICAGTVAIMFYNLFAAYLRAIGNSKTPLFFLVFSAILNILLDLLFIVSFHMGVAGAALATVAAQGLSAVLCAIYIYRHVDALRPDKTDWHFVGTCAAKQLSIGIPMALETGITASGTLIMQAALNIYGTLSIAGSTAAYKVINFLSQGLYSLGQTMASYAGQNFGSGKIERIWSGTKAAMVLVIIYSLSAAGLGVVFLPHLISLFFSGDVSLAEVLPWAKIAHHECALFYPFLGAIFVYRNTLQGCGFSVQAMAMGVFELGARICMALLSMHIHSYPLAIGADPSAWLAAGTLGYILYRYLLGNKHKSVVQGDGEG
ncbi:MAG: MATE family efflux transporter [Lachnospiraceae bacterium]|nr:MATE family efflux transporter [Lachnospiraceae bacterium]